MPELLWIMVHPLDGWTFLTQDEYWLDDNLPANCQYYEVDLVADAADERAELFLLEED